MPKRKTALESDSGLSSPPESIVDQTDAQLNGQAEPSVKRRKVKKEAVEAETALVQPKKASNKPRGARKVKIEAEEEEAELEDDVQQGAKDLSSKPKRKRKIKTKTEEVKEEEEEADENDEIVEKKGKKKRKTKAEKEAEAMPLAARTAGHKLYIGAHVSAAGGVHNAVVNSVHIGANAFALFLKSQRKWANPPLQDDHRLSFHNNCKTHTYNQMRHVVPHGSYLVNLAHTDQARTDQAYTSYLDDLKRCESLGINLYNIHPGNTVSNDRQKAITHLASNLNAAHRETSSVITLLENMAAGGNVLGSTFEDLRDIIALVENKERIGVCIDTCHAFAGGYDLRTPETFHKTMQTFDALVGLQYLRAVHLNDSKAPFASHRDLHANIGTGFLGLRAFHNIVNDPRFEGLPLILETPIEVRDENGNLVKDEKGKEKEDKGIWAREIKMLEGLVGMDVEGEEFRALERKLARQGEPERERLMEQIERKKEKEEKKKGAGKGKKGKKVESESEGSELGDE
ncbi:DNA-(apurinic or apyrimidinic site) lyase 1 [Lecanosticta acicola]|uniref:Apurinic-apyrimidinic endonuclease 1 n=1 Tax=Lecanosticta acicola TaxID=111012 RepID=A0AAI8YYC6_9PEZI|nr:DNA-(apurinic or apyrimidinic site) lyase 1 [Lecanosticta acicola]